MRASVIVSVLLFASGAAATPAPMDAKATRATLAALHAEGNTDKGWAMTRALFAPSVYFRLDYESPGTGVRHESAGWLTGVAQQRMRREMMLFVSQADDPQCAPPICAVGMGHSTTHVYLRRRLDGRPEILGLLVAHQPYHFAPEGFKAMAPEPLIAEAWQTEVEAGETTALPPIYQGAMPPAVQKAARARVKTGLRALKAGKYTAAIADLRHALRIDPSHLRARYDLARAYALHGQVKAARQTLRGLEKPECRGCAAYVTRARTDMTFAVLRTDKRPPR
ncbi:MAG: hypothetical protein ACI9U2_004677 [Bradymonadia bacterium]|jgi:hypothetical protein